MVERSLFVSSYLPALYFKILLSASLSEIMTYFIPSSIRKPIYVSMLLVWLIATICVFTKLSIFSYGIEVLSPTDFKQFTWVDL